ncbi:tripartite tricarboxylate transporter substrate binding protein [Oscillibacter sp. MSJ-2]|uniref:Tripartite tricarboxylate transporter substrate binding protein n=1 Tax=Dysosmobacter acutus TaxID=2841504 RepID=A0ABS6F5T5_9FIRM|nr:tripartite tricarboxylate transporter substrate binding protein [Dysosmobacter acutus]MBU5625653.1 tripartite tricarboxylate transporter substrate binding protein [Dysosmobacter acutus]
MKRLFALLLTLVMCASLLAACGNGGGSSGSAGGSSTSGSGAGSSASTDSYPDGTITITVAYSAGGSSDKLARMVQPYLQEELGVNVVVENQGGASGQIAAESFLRKDPDGYNLLAVNAPGIFYTVALQDTTYDYADLVPVWVESYDPIVMLALNGSEFNTLGDFIDGAKANPGKYSVGYAAGGGQQATALWLKNNLDLDIKLVSYDGGSDASAALLGGHVDVIFGDAYARVDLVTEAKALGIGTTEANSAWPDAVSFNEQLKAYNVEMPSDEFQARMGCYWVSKDFVDQYPDRYQKLISAFEAVAADEAYLQNLKDANVYDSAVLASGADYAQQMEQMANEVETVVAPMFSES